VVAGRLAHRDGVERRTALVLDAATLSSFAALSSRPGVIYAATWSAHDVIAAGHQDGKIRLWRSLQHVADVAAHGSNVSGLAFSPDGSLLASTGWDNVARISTELGDHVQTLPLRSSRHFHVGVAFDPAAGEALAVIGLSGVVVFERRVARRSGLGWKGPRLSGLVPHLMSNATMPREAWSWAAAIIDGIARTGYAQIFLERGEELLLAGEHITRGKVRYDVASRGGVIGQALASGLPLWYADVTLASGYIAAEKSTRSEFAVPLSRTIRGVINVESTEPDGISVEDRDAIVAFAQQLAKAPPPDLRELPWRSQPDPPPAA
jgi:putative methionine-R-sulfoxide reductase with GAF domain